MVPPVAFFLPVALWFLRSVLGGHVYRNAVTVASVVGYAAGALVAAVLFATLARAVDVALERRTDPSKEVSACLGATVVTAALLWCGWGGVLAAIGAATVLPTVLGVQYFFEAALIVGAPAMAWTYWRGKRLLVKRVEDAPSLSYVGRTYSIGTKIALVFVGFYIVSVGAVVLVISSSVAGRLGEAAALEVTRFSIMVAVPACIAFAVATYFLTRDVTRPLAALKRLAAEMAAGNFEHAPRIFADDETGELARSFGVTTETLRPLIRHLGRSGTSITEGVRLMTSGTETLVHGAREQTALAQESDGALSLVRSEAQRVLVATEQVAENTYASAERASEMKASSAEVAKRMDDLLQSVEKSSSSTRELDSSAQEMSQRTQNLSMISSEVLAFVSQMDATVQQIHRTAEATAGISRETRETADEGRRAVSETVAGIRSTQESTRRMSEAFDSLQQSLGKIDQILVFIDELTNRTNLLSLNAAIIAAQAGENDSGFSVIADEVRQLADRTRSATKEIAGIIRAVQPITREAVAALNEGVANVDQSVSLANNANVALGRILASSERSLDMNQVISNSLQEQSRAGHHLHELAARLSDNSSEIHRAMQGQAVATELLAHESERVRDIASQVKRASDEQVIAGGGIAQAMELIAADINNVRDRLERQLSQAEQVAAASRVTLTIAEKNHGVAEQFSSALQSLLHSGKAFEAEVARFRV